MRSVAYNPGALPVPVDVSGRRAGGHEWIDVDTDDPVTAAALAGGNLVEVERPENDVDMAPAARAAFEQADAHNDAAPASAVGDDDAGDPGDPDASASSGRTRGRAAKKTTATPSEASS